MKIVPSPNRTIHRAITLFFGIFLALNISAQQTAWMDSMLSKDATFNEIKQAFDAEWAGKDYVKGQGWKQFHRWEAFWETRLLPDGSFPDFKEAYNEFKEYMSANGQAKSLQNAGNWSPMGPFNYSNTASWSPGIGRVNFIMEDPNNTNIIYIGAPAGGIWKSINGGSTWIPLGDDLAVMGISAIGISAANSNVIYLATGDADGGDTYSIGVMKSTDGGLTWAEVGNVAGNLRDIIVDPTDEDIAYVASNGGVYKTIDGGTTWTQILTGSYRDLEMKPGAPTTIYAATNDQVRYSTNSGTTWTVATGIPTGGDRIAMAVSPANSAYVYVLAANSTGAYQGIYRSTNSGVSFTARNTTTDVFDGSTQSWYDMAIGVSSTDANIIFTGCLNVWKSTNGGTTLTQVNNWSTPSGAAYTHADIHFLRGYNGKIYCGSDGGVYRSTNNGSSFTDLTVGVQISQFYRIGGSKNDVTTIAGGLQDNGGYVYNNATWKVYYGADGMEAAISPTNSSLLYGMIQNGNLYRSTNAGNTNQGLGRPEAGRWVTPMQFDPNANRIVAGYNDLYEYNGGWNQLSTYNFPELLRNIEFYDGNSNIIYVSTNSLIYRTVNNGAGFFNITNNLTSILAGNVITSIEVDPTNSNRVWVSIGGYTDGVKVAYTANGGTTWTNVSGSLPNLPCNIVKYESTASAPNALYVGMDIGVYYRDDALGDFIPFMINLPNVIVNDLELNEAAGMIRAGTYGRGVWESGSYSIAVVADDAGVVNVIHPRGSICGETFTPEVTLRNFGTNALTSVNINYQVGNGAVSTLNWTGNIASWTSVNVTLPSITAGGTNTFKSWTTLPNGVADINLDNDSVIETYTAIANGTLLYTQLIQDCWGSEISWDIIDSGGLVQFSGGPYSDGNGQVMMLDSVCLAAECYDFVINDAYGDGMSGASYASCGADGDYYLITDSGDTLVQMGVANYGSQAIHNFCIAANDVADFSWNGASFCPNQTVTFTDASSGATSWSWDFGVGATPATAVGAGPHNVTYTSGGTKTVVLNINGGAETSTQSVTINSNPLIPTISASGATTFCAGNSVTLTSSESTGNEWSTLATSNTISVGSSGSYSVTYTDANGCSASSAPVTVTVNPLPSAPTITPSGPTTLCAGNSLTLSSSQPTGNFWSTNSTSSSISVSNSGNYTVAYTNANGCQATSSPISVTVNPQPIISLGSIVNPSTCGTATGSFVVNGSGTGTVSWSGAASGSAVGVTLPYSTTGLAAGLYNVVFMDASGCASVSQTTTLNDPTPPPTPTITASGSLVFCDGGNVILTSSASSGNAWSDGSTGTSITVNASGTYGVAVTLAGCSATSLPISVVVNPIPATPIIAATGSTSICPGESVVLSSSYGSGIEWNTLETSQNITVATTGVYEVTYTDGNGCASTSAGISVVMNQSPVDPVITASGSTSLCPGGSVVLTSSYATGNEWNTLETTGSITTSTTGVYTVTYTDGNGCTATSAGISVVMNQNPVAPVIGTSGSTILCAGDSVILSTTYPNGYVWSTMETTPEIVVFDAGSYSITYTHPNGCSATSVPVTVIVYPLPIVTLSAADTTCVQAGNVLLTGTPAGGVYSGSGVVGDQFDPSVFGPGTFTVDYTFTTNHGCVGTATETIIVEECVSLFENELTNILVYPNPTNGEFTIQLEGEFKFEVHDARGRIVQIGDGMNTAQVDLTEVQVGIYFLHITNAIGQKVVRVVKN